MDQKPDMPRAAKPWKAIAVVLAVVLLAFCIGGWWYVQSVQNAFEERAQTIPQGDDGLDAVPETSQPVSDLWFDPSTVAVGDTIGAWTVVGFEYSEPGIPRSVRLSGSVEVSGAFTYNAKDAPFYAELVFFKTDAAGAALLPRPADRPFVDGEGKIYRAFAFVDDSAVRQVFGTPGNAGSATVLVKDYEVTLMGGEAIDTARLVRLIKR